MLDAVCRRRAGREDGFTLIELMVVVLIIAILIAIAVPTFLGARQRAQDRAAQSVLRNALTAEKTYYTDNQTYTGDPAALKAIEPGLSFLSWDAGNWDTASATRSETAVYNAWNPALVILTTRSASGRRFALVSMDQQFGSSPAGVYYRSTSDGGYPWDPGWWDPVACSCGWKTTGW